MKLVLLSIIMFCSTSVFGQTTDQDFFDQVKGRSITGKSVENIDTVFEFSKDGKTVMLKKNQGYKHTFVQMVGDIAVYEGKRGNKKHYDAFQITENGVMVTSNDEVGGEKLNSNTPEGIAEALEKKSLMFTFQ